MVVGALVPSACLLASALDTSAATTLHRSIASTLLAFVRSFPNMSR
jgi:hypothetical protein